MSLACLVCSSAQVQEVMESNRRYFYCETCQKLYERAHDSTYGRDIAINTDEGVYHLVSSAVIWKNNRFLLIKRRSYPFGYTFPGGHLEYSEEPLQALKREVFEELGLKVKKAKLFFEGRIDVTKCRYGSDRHIWYLYHCICEDSTPILNPESESADWYTKEEALTLELTPSAHHIISELIQS